MPFSNINAWIYFNTNRFFSSASKWQVDFFKKQPNEVRPDHMTIIMHVCTHTHIRLKNTLNALKFGEIMNGLKGMKTKGDQSLIFLVY